MSPKLWMTWSDDLATNGSVKTVVISEVKAECIALVKEINRSGEPLATISPPSIGERRLGAQKHHTTVKGPI